METPKVANEPAKEMEQDVKLMDANIKPVPAPAVTPEPQTTPQV